MCALRQPHAEFHPARQITDADVEGLVRQIRSRVLRYLRDTGKLADLDAVDHDTQDASLFDALRAAAIQGKTAIGPTAGRNDPRVGQGTQLTRDFARALGETHGDQPSACGAQEKARRPQPRRRSVCVA